MSRKKNIAGDAPGTRQLRVGELIRHALSEILQRDEVRDPGVSGRSITVTEVTVSPDMRNATAYVEPLGGLEVEEVLAGLNRCSSYLSGRIARAVHMKYAPRLSFHRDRSFDNASHIDAVMRAARADDERRRKAGSDGTGDDGGTNGTGNGS